MGNKLPALFKTGLAYGWPIIPCHGILPQEPCETKAVVDPKAPPLFISPKAQISKDGRIQNLSDFKMLDDVFEFSRCLQCQALQHEHYGSSGESLCMHCHSLSRMIKEKNILRHQILRIFSTSSLIH